MIRTSGFLFFKKGFKISSRSHENNRRATVNSCVQDWSGLTAAMAASQERTLGFKPRPRTEARMCTVASQSATCDTARTERAPQSTCRLRETKSVTSPRSPLNRHFFSLNQTADERVIPQLFMQTLILYQIFFTVLRTVEFYSLGFCGNKCMFLGGGRGRVIIPVKNVFTLLISSKYFPSTTYVDTKRFREGQRKKLRISWGQEREEGMKESHPRGLRHTYSFIMCTTGRVRSFWHPLYFFLTKSYTQYKPKSWYDVTTVDLIGSCFADTPQASLPIKNKIRLLEIHQS